MSRGHIFAERDFYHNRVDTLVCKLLDILDNDQSDSHTIAEAGLKDHRTICQKWNEANQPASLYIPSRFNVQGTDLVIILLAEKQWMIQRTWNTGSYLNTWFEWEIPPASSDKDEFFQRTRFTLEEAKLHCEAYLALPHSNS
jgi:hypothetical protein